MHSCDHYQGPACPYRYTQMGSVTGRQTSIFMDVESTTSVVLHAPSTASFLYTYSTVMYVRLYIGPWPYVGPQMPYFVSAKAACALS